MLNRFLLAFFLCTAVFSPSILDAAGILGNSEKSSLVSAMESAGTADYVIDLNVRIDIPDQYRRDKYENPVTAIGNVSGKIEGVTLWGTLVRPKDDAADIAAGRVTKRPTIIVATCYRREFCIIPWGVPLVKHGYNVLGVDLRGSASSEGQWDTFTFEEQYDMAYIVDHWLPGDIAEGGIEKGREWSDGTVGMIGASYMAITQFNTAGLCLRDENGVPGHLKALFAYVPQSDPYKETLIQNGNLDIWFMMGLWLPMTDLLAMLPPLSLLGEEEFFPTQGEISDAMDAWKEHALNVENHLELAVNPMLEYDGDFINPRSSMQYWPVKPEGGWVYYGQDFGNGKYPVYPAGAKIPEGERVIPDKLPVFVLGGWYCIFTSGTLNHYKYGLSQHAVGDKALVMGPWYHLDGSMGLGLPDLYKTQAVAARWFDWKIKGKADSFMAEFPVLLYVMGEDRWRAEKAWPLPETRIEKKTLWLSRKKASKIDGDYFTSGLLSNAKNNFGLTWNVNSGDYSDANDAPVLKHNPAKLHGGLSRSMVRFYIGVPDILNIFSRLLKGEEGAGDDAVWEDARSDEKGVLTFTTEPLDEDVEITGPIKLTFWAETAFKTPTSGEWNAVLELIKAYFKIGSDDENLIYKMINRKDVQWVAEIHDVFEDGRAKNLTSGWLAASHRPYDPDPASSSTLTDPEYTAFDPFYCSSDMKPDMISENTVYSYVIELWPLCNVFKKGHRIRLSLSGSDFPHLLPVLRPSINTLRIDKDHQAGMEFDVVNSGDEGKTWKWIGSKSDYVAGYSDEYNANQAANTYLMAEEEKSENGGTDDPQTTGGETASSDDSSSSGGSLCFIDSTRI